MQSGMAVVGITAWVSSRSTPFRGRTRGYAREENGRGWRGGRGRDNPHTVVAAGLWSWKARRAAYSRGGVGGAHPDGYGRRGGGSGLAGHGLSATPSRSLDPGQ
jgi:hypothetical protein